MIEMQSAPIMVTLVTNEAPLARSNVVLGATVNEGPVPIALFPGAKPISEMKPKASLGINQALEAAANAWDKSEPTFMAEAMQTATKAWRNVTSPRSYEIAEEVRAWRIGLIVDNVKDREDLELVNPSQSLATIAEAEIIAKSKPDIQMVMSEVPGLVGEDRRQKEQVEIAIEAPTEPEIVFQEDTETEGFRLAKIRMIIAGFNEEVDMHSVSEEMGDEEEADKSKLFNQLNIKGLPDGSYRRLREEVDQDGVVSKDNALLIAIKAILRHFPVKIGKGSRNVNAEYIDDEVLERRASVAELKG